MARLEGTGKDPLGRYGKGEIFDVEKYTASTPDSDADRVANPVYQEIIDNGWAKPVKPEDDPGRTVTQIADHVVATGGAVPSNPDDAAVAARIAGDEYAIVHAGDPKAKADGDLKTATVREGQGSEDPLQRESSASEDSEAAPAKAS